MQSVGYMYYIHIRYYEDKYFIQISSSFEETDVVLKANTHPPSRDQTIGQPSGRPPNS